MNRRKFLTLASSITGYTVMARVNGLGAEPPPGASLDQISKQFDVIAPPDEGGARLPAEPHMRLVELTSDVFIAGGGISGVCSALAAARHGAKVVMCQDRSRLGGNSSSEVKMHIVGADIHGSRSGWREGGLIEELRLDDAVNNPQRSWELWDFLLYDKIKSEPNITLLLDSPLYSVDAKDGLIQGVRVRCDKTEHLYSVKSKIYVDATGDSRMALEAGAEMRKGREARSEFNESLAMETPDKQTQGCSILFTARDFGKPIAFKPPKWARKVTKEMLRFRPVSSWEYGYWWIEWGGQIDTIRDNERIRFELLSILMGIWDYIKNSGDQPTSANWGMDWCGMIPGKREARRVMGDHILTQHDLLGTTGDFEDAVCIGGWPMDDHPPSGFDMHNLKPNVSIKPPEVYNIPYRCLYSKTIANLMMAGRNISTTHAAFSSSRVMATCAVVGQATGTAAALCAKDGLAPRQLGRDKSLVNRLQQILLRDDQTIKNRKNTDPADFACSAKVTASAEHETSKAENIINGLVRDLPGKWDNRWAAQMTKEGPWIELAWDKPMKLGHVQITFDTGFQRQLTLSAQNAQNKAIIRAAQPETVKDYDLIGTTTDGKTVTLASVRDNHQRLNRHWFAPVEVKSVKLHVTATNGSDTARVYEVRCYA